MTYSKTLFVDASSIQKIFNANLLDYTNVFLKSTCGAYSAINDSTAEFFKVSIANVIGHNDYDLAPSNESVKVIENDKQVLKSNRLQLLIAANMLIRWCFFVNQDPSP
ncbi:MAG: hypothetical protein KAT71_02040 [Gammaproteobacteria bacterium]|nr:hypothetical protein [Gammaproteobacteria bacterium]